jgi:hypothetical protein
MIGRKNPRKLWPEIVRGVCYTYNRMPSSAIAGDIPWERLHGQPVSSLAHLQVLGSLVTYLDPRPAAKLAPRSRPGILVGYRSDGRGSTAVYRVRDDVSHKIVDVVDVTVNERQPAPASGGAGADAEGGNSPYEGIIGTGATREGAVPAAPQGAVPAVPQGAVPAAPAAPSVDMPAQMPDDDDDDEEPHQHQGEDDDSDAAVPPPEPEPALEAEPQLRLTLLRLHQRRCAAPRALPAASRLCATRHLAPSWRVR